MIDRIATEGVIKMAFQKQNLIRHIGLGQPESTPVETVVTGTSLKQEDLQLVGG